MALLAAEIVERTQAPIRYNRSPFEEWYIGIGSEPNRLLFMWHNVPILETPWLILEAIDEDAARDAQSDLMRIGCDGGTDESRESPRFVFSYRKVPGVTKP